MHHCAGVADTPCCVCTRRLRRETLTASPGCGTNPPWRCMVLHLGESRTSKKCACAGRCWCSSWPWHGRAGSQTCPPPVDAQIVKMSLSGEAFQFFMSSIYTITGALMGTTPGGEFLAAIEAARGVGAQARRARTASGCRLAASRTCVDQRCKTCDRQSLRTVLPHDPMPHDPLPHDPLQVVLGDRDQEATMRRLQYYTPLPDPPRQPHPRWAAELAAAGTPGFGLWEASSRQHALGCRRTCGACATQWTLGGRKMAAAAR